MATVTGNLEGVIDNAVEEGSVVIALCGYGPQVPRVQGTALFGSVTSQDIEVDGDGTFTAEVPGNDEIAPAGTYYTVTIKNANGDVVQCNAYLLLGDTTYDLNVTDPFDPTQPIPPLPPLIINQLLILAFSPTPDFPGDGYTAWQITLTGDVTSSTVSNVATGNLYTFIIKQDGAGGHAFTWPPNVLNATPVFPAPNSTTVQTFVVDENLDLYPIGGATYYQ